MRKRVLIGAVGAAVSFFAGLGLLWDSLGAWSLLVSPVIVVVMFLIGQLLAEIIQPLRGFEHCPKCGGWRKHGCNGICQR